MTKSRAAMEIGMTNMGIAEAMKTDRRFFEDVHQLLATMTDDVEQALYATALRGNVEAQKFWLTNRDQENWANRSRVEANYQIAPGVFNKEGWSPAIRRKLAAFDNRGQAAIEITVAAGSFEEVDVTLPENMDEGVLQFIKVVAADSTDSSIAINTPAGSILTWLNFDPSTAARYYQNVSIMNDELGLVDHKFTMRVINDDAQSADYEIWMRIKAT
jgi:hypothetical protein